MIGLRRALVLLGLLGLAGGAMSVALIAGSDHVQARGAQAVAVLVVGWAFIGTGLFAWSRRPDNPFGALMTAVGLTWFFPALTAANESSVFTVGVLLSNIYLAAFIHMVLVYPDGGFERPWHRWLVAGGYVLALVGPLPALLFQASDEYFDCDDCPPSAIRIARDDTVFTILDNLTTVVAIALVFAVVWVLVRRWRQASSPRRRALAPVLWSGVALAILLAGALTATSVHGPSGLSDIIASLGQLALAITPFAFLMSLLKSRVTQAGAATDLLLRLGERPRGGRLREVLAAALRDPSVQVLYWLEERGHFVDEAGKRADPDDSARQSWTRVELEGVTVGAIVYDTQVGEDRELVRSVAAAAGLALEHELLEAQLRARVEDLRASRARLVEVGTAERRRLERNLHDGAQQRLVALSLQLRLAQSKLASDPVKASILLAGAQDELAQALEELRELARGIHPVVLSDRGLETALEALVGRSPVPVELAALPDERLPEAVEAAAYFVVAEALINAKYAGATHATVSVERRNGAAIVEVADDGVGGADPAAGTGLRGLADRVGALDGSLRIESPRGAGTRLHVEIPV